MATANISLVKSMHALGNQAGFVSLVTSVITNSFLDPDYHLDEWEFDTVTIIENFRLNKQYLIKRAEMKVRGSDLKECLLFACYKGVQHAANIMENGLHVTSASNRCSLLGDAQKGVLLCKHPDIQLKAATNPNQDRCLLIIFRTTCGTVRWVQSDGTRNSMSLDADSHISLFQPNRNDTLQHQALSSQVYLFDADPNSVSGFAKRPRHCIPIISVVFKKMDRICTLPREPQVFCYMLTASQPIVDLTGDGSDASNIGSTQLTERLLLQLRTLAEQVFVPNVRTVRPMLANTLSNVTTPRTFSVQPAILRHRPLSAEQASTVQSTGVQPCTWSAQAAATTSLPVNPQHSTLYSVRIPSHAQAHQPIRSVNSAAPTVANHRNSLPLSGHHNFITARGPLAQNFGQTSNGGDTAPGGNYSGIGTNPCNNITAESYIGMGNPLRFPGYQSNNMTGATQLNYNSCTPLPTVSVHHGSSGNVPVRVPVTENTAGQRLGWASMGFQNQAGATSLQYNNLYRGCNYVRNPSSGMVRMPVYHPDGSLPTVNGQGFGNLYAAGNQPNQSSPAPGQTSLASRHAPVMQRFPDMNSSQFRYVITSEAVQNTAQVPRGCVPLYSEVVQPAFRIPVPTRGSSNSSTFDIPFSVSTGSEHNIVSGQQMLQTSVPAMYSTSAVSVHPSGQITAASLNVSSQAQLSDHQFQLLANNQSIWSYEFGVMSGESMMLGDVQPIVIAPDNEADDDSNDIRGVHAVIKQEQRKRGRSEYHNETIIIDQVQAQSSSADPVQIVAGPAMNDNQQTNLFDDILARSDLTPKNALLSDGFVYNTDQCVQPFVILGEIITNTESLTTRASQFDSNLIGSVDVARNNDSIPIDQMTEHSIEDISRPMNQTDLSTSDSNNLHPMLSEELPADSGVPLPACISLVACSLEAANISPATISFSLPCSSNTTTITPTTCTATTTNILTAINLPLVSRSSAVTSEPIVQKKQKGRPVTSGTSPIVMQTPVFRVCEDGSIELKMVPTSLSMFGKNSMSATIQFEKNVEEDRRNKVADAVRCSFKNFTIEDLDKPVASPSSLGAAENLAIAQSAGSTKRPTDMLATESVTISDDEVDNCTVIINSDDDAAEDDMMIVVSGQDETEDILVNNTEIQNDLSSTPAVDDPRLDNEPLSEKGDTDDIARVAEVTDVNHQEHMEETQNCDADINCTASTGLGRNLQVLDSVIIVEEANEADLNQSDLISVDSQESAAESVKQIGVMASEGKTDFVSDNFKQAAMTIEIPRNSTNSDNTSATYSVSSHDLVINVDDRLNIELLQSPDYEIDVINQHDNERPDNNLNEPQQREYHSIFEPVSPNSLSLPSLSCPLYEDLSPAESVEERNTDVITSAKHVSSAETNICSANEDSSLSVCQHIPSDGDIETVNEDVPGTNAEPRTVPIDTQHHNIISYADGMLMSNEYDPSNQDHNVVSTPMSDLCGFNRFDAPIDRASSGCITYEAISPASQPSATVVSEIDAPVSQTTLREIDPAYENQDKVSGNSLHCDPDDSSNIQRTPVEIIVKTINLSVQLNPVHESHSMIVSNAGENLPSISSISTTTADPVDRFHSSTEAIVIGPSEQDVLTGSGKNENITSSCGTIGGSFGLNTITGTIYSDAVSLSMPQNASGADTEPLSGTISFNQSDQADARLCLNLPHQEYITNTTGLAQNPVTMAIDDVSEFSSHAPADEALNMCPGNESVSLASPHLDEGNSSVSQALAIGIREVENGESDVSSSICADFFVPVVQTLSNVVGPVESHTREVSSKSSNMSTDDVAHIMSTVVDSVDDSRSGILSIASGNVSIPVAEILSNIRDSEDESLADVPSIMSAANVSLAPTMSPVMHSVDDHQGDACSTTSDSVSIPAAETVTNIDPVGHYKNDIVEIISEVCVPATMTSSSTVDQDDNYQNVSNCVKSCANKFASAKVGEHCNFNDIEPKPVAVSKEHVSASKQSKCLSTSNLGVLKSILKLPSSEKPIKKISIDEYLKRTRITPGVHEAASGVVQPMVASATPESLAINCLSELKTDKLLKTSMAELHLDHQLERKTGVLHRDMLASANQELLSVIKIGQERAEIVYSPTGTGEAGLFEPDTDIWQPLDQTVKQSTIQAKEIETKGDLSQTRVNVHVEPPTNHTNIEISNNCTVSQPVAKSTAHGPNQQIGKVPAAEIDPDIRSNRDALAASRSDLQEAAPVASGNVTLSSATKVSRQGKNEPKPMQENPTREIPLESCDGVEQPRDPRLLYLNNGSYIRRAGANVELALCNSRMLKSVTAVYTRHKNRIKTKPRLAASCSQTMESDSEIPNSDLQINQGTTEEEEEESRTWADKVNVEPAASGEHKVCLLSEPVFESCSMTPMQSEASKLNTFAEMTEMQVSAHSDPDNLKLVDKQLSSHIRQSEINVQDQHNVQEEARDYRDDEVRTVQIKFNAPAHSRLENEIEILMEEDTGNMSSESDDNQMPMQYSPPIIFSQFSPPPSPNITPPEIGIIQCPRRSCTTVPVPACSTVSSKRKLHTDDKRGKDNDSETKKQELDKVDQNVLNAINLFQSLSRHEFERWEDRCSKTLSKTKELTSQVFTFCEIPNRHLHALSGKYLLIAKELDIEEQLTRVHLELERLHKLSQSPQKSSKHVIEKERHELLLQRDLLYNGLYRHRNYHKSRLVYVLPKIFRLKREWDRFISVEGSLMFLREPQLPLHICQKLYCLRVEIEDGEKELRKKKTSLPYDDVLMLACLYRRRKRILQDICCSSKSSLSELRDKYIVLLRRYRTMERILDLDQHEIAFIKEQREQLDGFINACKYLKIASNNHQNVWEFDQAWLTAMPLRIL